MLRERAKDETAATLPPNTTPGCFLSSCWGTANSTGTQLQPLVQEHGAFG